MFIVQHEHPGGFSAARGTITAVCWINVKWHALVIVFPSENPYTFDTNVNWMTPFLYCRISANEIQINLIQ